VLSTNEKGSLVYLGRRLSLWNLKTKSILAEKMEKEPADIERYPCGRVEVSVKLNKILLCSPETYLEVIDPDSLEATGKIGFREAQYIYDFVVDDVRAQVAVLALESGSIRLSIYSLPDGAKLQQLAFP
jgi:hypothetical protein